MLILQTAAKARIQCLAFAPDGATLAVAGRHYPGVGLYDLATGTKRLSFDCHARHVTTLAFAPDGQTVASADHAGFLKIWGTANGSERLACTSLQPGNVQLAFAPDGRTLAAGFITWWGTAQIRRWDVANHRELAPFRGRIGRITALSFSPDGKTLATGGRDRLIRLWDAASGAERVGFGARVMDFLRLLGWGAAAEEELKASLASATEIRGLAFSPDGRILAAATGWRATIWDADSGQLLANLKDHTALVDRVAFSPNGRMLATASRDGTVKFWDLASLDLAKDHHHNGKNVTVRATWAWDLGKVYSVAFAPDGLRIAAGGDAGQIVIWDLDE